MYYQDAIDAVYQSEEDQLVILDYTSIHGPEKTVYGEVRQVEQGDWVEVVDHQQPFRIHGERSDDRDTGEVVVNGRKMGMFDEMKPIPDHVLENVRKTVQQNRYLGTPSEDKQAFLAILGKAFIDLGAPADPEVVHGTLEFIVHYEEE